VLNRLLDRIEDGLAVVAAALIAFSVLSVTIDVGSRYFINRPLPWVFEVTEYILLFVPCLGMAWLARNDGHVVIDLVTSKLSEAVRIRLAAAVALVVAAICFFIAWWGWVATRESYAAKAVIENILQTPQFAIYAAIPFGFFLCGVEFLRKSWRAWHGELPVAATH
jgi:TRAP-type C4-dicarboxylate transport system permease small subunit